MLAPASKRAGDKGAPNASVQRNVDLGLTWQALLMSSSLYTATV